MNGSIVAQPPEFLPIWIYMLLLSGFIILAGLGLRAVHNYGDEFLEETRAWWRQTFTRAGDDASFLHTTCPHLRPEAFADRDGLKTIFCHDCKRGLTRQRVDGIFRYEETAHAPGNDDYVKVVQAMTMVTHDRRREHLALAVSAGRPVTH